MAKLRHLIHTLIFTLILSFPAFILAETPITVGKYYSEILELTSDNYDTEIEELEQTGVIVLYRRDNLALSLIPSGGNSPTDIARSKSSIHRLVKLKNHKDRNVKGGKSFNVPTLSQAHNWYDAYTIHKGLEGTAYDGTGVVVGLCDIGFDASHIAFKRADGSSRISRTVQYLESEGKRIECSTPEEVASWLTDRDTHTHATHVAGILAGSYDADGLAGAAPGAEIVATTSELTDVGILAGVEDIIAYAKEAGKTCVVNLSVGNYTGPHDGTSLFARYLDKCGEDAIICISSGNEGNSNNTFSVDFSEKREDMMFKLTSITNANFEIAGITDFWMRDKSQLHVIPIIIDTSKNDEITYIIDDIDFSATPVVVLGTVPGNKDSYGEGVEYIYNETLVQYFTGEILLYGEVDGVNGRYHVYMQYELQTDIAADGKPWGRYLLGGKASAAAGTHLDIYADGVYSNFTKFSQSDLQPSGINSISDLATGHNVICVGLYNNHKEVKYFNGNSWTVDEPQGEISSYSGYGTLVDGRILPHTSGPGIPVVSAYSSPYLANPANSWRLGRMSVASRGDYKPTDITILPEDAGTYHPEYFYWGAEGGTSMSTPYVAGYIATWLQANPDLKIADIQGIIKSTNDTSGQCAYDVSPRNGQGFFRPVEGLREALFLATSLPVIEYEKPVIRVSGDMLHVGISQLGEGSLPLTVTDMNGRRVLQTLLTDTYMTIDISLLSPGVYIVTIPGHSPAKIIR